ncbi:MAG: hypothetical protein M1830_010363 [Pleopsidium flavum]|nr:MAG: hypothetical protein M1830_010363 [Pleopsidium flavum]
MSNYPENRRRRDQRDSGHYGRDPRERSPLRHQRSLREGRYDDGSHGNRQSFHATQRDSAEPSRRVLSTRIPIPSGGREFKVNGPAMQGTVGHSIRLNANFFVIQSLPVVKTYQYDMQLRVPKSSQRRGNDKVSPLQQMKALTHDAVKTFWGDDFVFDGVSLAWSPIELIAIGETVSTTVDLEGHSVQKPNQVEITIRNNGALDIKALVDYIQGGHIELDYMGNQTIEPLMKWLNAIFRKDPASKLITRSKSNAYFERTPSAMKTLSSTGGMLEALRGTFQTAQIRFGRVGLCVDTISAAFWTPGKSLVDLANALAGVPPNQDLQGWFQANRTQFYHSCQRLEGMFINVKHLNSSKNARKMKLIRISQSDAQNTEFDESDVSTGEVRLTTVDSLWHLGSAADFRDQGRILPAPIPDYSSGTDTQAPVVGSWNLRNKRFLHPSSVASYGLLYLPAIGALDDATLQRFCRAMQSGFNAVGIRTPGALPAYLKGNPQGDIKQAIAELLAKTANAFRCKPELLIFLIHGRNEKLYRAIKNLCDIHFGVSSQVMQVEKSVLGQGQPQYIANIALKVNVKRGGVNSDVSEPLFKQAHWMMIPISSHIYDLTSSSADVTHPSPAALRQNPPSPSFTAISGSYNDNCSAYTAVTSAQNAKEELISDFSTMAKELLERFREKHRAQLPDSILFFRDGVGESQFSQILDTEVAKLKGGSHHIPAFLLQF